jgi:[ribosomal protein S5]-alanine N-acetyltransferase
MLTGVELRPLLPGDVDAVLAMRLRNRTHFLTGEPEREDEFFTEVAQRQALDALARDRLAGTREQFGVFVDGRLAGYVSLSQIFRGGFQNCYLGYAIDRDHTGRGLATAAIAAAVEHAWSLGLHRVQANVATTNHASMAALRKNGFRHEGTALRYLHIGGGWTDHEMFAKTVEEA